MKSKLMIRIMMIVLCFSVMMCSQPAVFAEEEEVKMCTIDAKSYDETLGTVSGGGVYESGADIVLTATPKSEDVVFLGWYVDGERYYSTTTIEFQAVTDVEIFAKFSKDTVYEVTGFIVSTGSLDWNNFISNMGYYEYGETCTAVLGYDTRVTEFIGWRKGDKIVSTERRYEFVVTEDVDLCAYLKSKDSNTVGIVVLQHDDSNGEIYDAKKGATFEVKAESKENAQFVAWTVNGKIASRNSIYSFKATENALLVPIYSNSLSVFADGNDTIIASSNKEEFTFEISESDFVNTGNSIFKSVGIFAPDGTGKEVNILSASKTAEFKANGGFANILPRVALNSQAGDGKYLVLAEIDTETEAEAVKSMCIAANGQALTTRTVLINGKKYLAALADDASEVVIYSQNTGEGSLAVTVLIIAAAVIALGAVAFVIMNRKKKTKQTADA